MRDLVDAAAVRIKAAEAASAQEVEMLNDVINAASLRVKGAEAETASETSIMMDVIAAANVRIKRAEARALAAEERLAARPHDHTADDEMPTHADIVEVAALRIEVAQQRADAAEQALERANAQVVQERLESRRLRAELRTLQQVGGGASLNGSFRLSTPDRSVASTPTAYSRAAPQRPSSAMPRTASPRAGSFVTPCASGRPSSAAPAVGRGGTGGSAGIWEGTSYSSKAFVAALTEIRTLRQRLPVGDPEHIPPLHGPSPGVVLSARGGR